MSCNTLCLAEKPKDYNKLFFGDYGNFQRIDKEPFPVFRKLAEASEGNTWFMNEIDYSRDKKGIQTLDDIAFRMFHLNILYQNNMDSLVPNIFSVLSDLATETWLTYLYSRISTEENIHCLKEEDEILTDNGWKKLKDLTLEDKVANWWKPDDDEKVGTITFENPKAIEKQFYSGKMVKWSMNNMNYVVTPKHRVVSYDVRKKKWKVKEALDCSIHNHNIPVSAYKVNGKKDKLSYIERLAIAFQADGSFMNEGAHKTHRGYAYRFSFKKERKIERMKWILDNIGCDYTITKSKQGYTLFNVWTDMEFDKKFNWVNLNEITSDWGKEFIKELRHWDGAKAQNSKAVRYINSNKKAIDKVMAIATISGYQVGVDDKGLERDSKAKHKSYTLYLTPKTHKTGREMKKELIDYNGNIVGVEVPSTFIVVRFDGKYVAVTGNSVTYSNGLNQVFGSKVSEMLDYVYEDEILKKRTQKEIEDADKFIEIVFKQNKEDDEAKKATIDALLRTFYLEGVKFPHSFFVTWTINKSFNNAIQGFSQALLLIAHDEMTTHTTTGKNVLNIIMDDEKQGFGHLKEYFETKSYEMAKETAELEMEWAEYLLKEGNIPGYNQDIANHFIKYWTDVRLKELHLEPIYNEKKSDIIDWFNSYRNLNNKQINLQEADNTNYQKGTLKNDLNKLDDMKIKL
jgi:ribonucleotide reductase beta subunit family protein with ferritin-like domain